MKPFTVGRFLFIMLPFAALFMLALVLAPLAGSVSIDIGGALRAWWRGFEGPAPTDVDILFYQRIPRVFLALIAGGCLAAAGAVFQAILRNPLATPYTLGVASGSALGASSAIYLGLAHRLAFGPVNAAQIFSLLGAFAVAALVYLLARRRGMMSMTALILAGVTIGLISSSLILFIRYLSDPHQAVMMDRWMMGSLDTRGYSQLGAMMPLILPGLALMFVSIPALNQIAFGEEMATGRGVDVAAVQRACFFGGSLVTAGIVAVTGPIGFVGLIVPHAVRAIIGSDHRILIPASFFAGGAFLAVCDVVSRTVISPAELPVGVVTAILGGPFFLYLLIKKY
jgi:iron complex transport system permease protein